METEIEVEVFRAGDYGALGTYRPEEIERLAGDYRPDLHEAPVTVDHRQEGPALGWVRSLRAAGGRLLARLGGLDPAFLGRLRAGAFKKRSVELYRRFEGTRRPYLRAVTFLGAAAPAVKGMPDPVFGETPAEPGPDCVTVLLAAEAPLLEAQAVPAAEAPPALPEPPAPVVPPVEPALPGPAAAPAAECADPDPAIEAFCERLQAQGRLLPAWEERGLRRFIAALDDAAPRAWTDAPGDAPRTPRGWFQDFLAALEPALSLGDLAAPGDEALFAEEAGDLSVRPGGAPVDPRSLELHRRVCRLRRGRADLTYAEALQQLGA